MGNEVGLMWRHFHVKFWRFALEKILLLVWENDLEHECKVHWSLKAEAKTYRELLNMVHHSSTIYWNKVCDPSDGSKNADGTFVGFFFIYNFNRSCVPIHDTICKCVHWYSWVEVVARTRTSFSLSFRGQGMFWSPSFLELDANVTLSLLCDLVGQGFIASTTYWIY